METVDSARMRTMNSNILLKMIWQQQEISRADISRITGMSRSTVSAIVAELMERGLVSEQGIGHSNGGRRPVMLSLNSDSYSILGLDISTTHVSAALTNLQGSIKESSFRATPVQNEPQETIDAVIEIIRGMMAKADADRSPLIGIGVGLPCPVFPDETVSPMNLSVLPAWEGFDLRKVVRETFQLPVIFENDANLGALAEMWWGKSPSKNLAFIKMSTGVGAGLMIDGKIHRGSRGLAGELGHFRLQTNGLKAHRNFNDILGAARLQQLVTEAAEKHPGSALAGGQPTIPRLLEALLANDKAAEVIMDEVAFHLGLAIANLLSVLDLDTVVLGGSLHQAGDLLIGRVSAVINEMSVWNRNLELRWSQLGEHQIAMGASTMILEKALDDLTLFPKPVPAVDSVTGGKRPLAVMQPI